MNEATMRDLRNRGAQVLDQVESGESVTISRDGRPVAELVPTARARLSAGALIERFRRIPEVDSQRLRDDIDAIVDQQL